MRVGRLLKERRSFRRNRGLLCFPLVCLFTVAAEAGTLSSPHGTIDLIAEQTAVQRGRDFWVGLRFQLEKGWHIYWINPGDSGEPPRVQWGLPTGFRAGPLQWPVPQRIEDRSLMDYGYEDEVLLSVNIQPPPGLAAGRDIRLGATLSWLVCKETCLPGRAALSLSLPVRKTATQQQSDWHALFARTRAGLPRAAPKHWKLTASLQGSEFLLEVETGKRETKATFFPFEANQFDNAAPQAVTPYFRGVRLSLAKSDQLLQPPSKLAGLLVLGAGHAYVIGALVAASK